MATSADAPARARAPRSARAQHGSAALARLAVALGASLAVVASLAGASAARIDVPKPLGFVSDFASVIDPSTRQRLDTVVRELKEKTGAEIAVVTVRTTAPETAFDYAMAIAEQWKPGDAKKDNGVVFLVAVDDREMQILTGYGVEGALPDGRVGEIRDTLVVPAFRAGDYARGIAEATTTMAALIAADSGVELTGAPAPVRRAVRRERGGGIGLAALLLFLVVSAFLNSFGGGRRGRRRRRGAWAAPIILGGGGFGRGGGFGGGLGGGGGFGGFGGGGFGGGGAGGRW